MAMPCLIMWRNTQNGTLGFIEGDDGSPFVFGSRADAEIHADEAPVLQAFPYQIVELEI